MRRSVNSSNNPDAFTVDLGAGTSTTMLVYESQGPPVASLILAHGAGAGQRSPFMVAFAQALAARGVDVVTFNFPYTEQLRKLPDRRPVLDACYVAVVNAARRELPGARAALFIGGKSMGGRIATHVAAADSDLPVLGLVLLGYPLHPPGRREQRRDAHLPDLRRPALIVQGSRDAFGTPQEFASVAAAMSPPPTLHVIEGGDHSFKVAGIGKAGQPAILEGIQQTIVQWMLSITRGDGAR